MKTKSISRLVRFFAAPGLSILLLGQSAFADAPDNWTTNQVSTNWFGLNSVVYGNGRYVAAGSWSDYGAIISSEDAIHWTVRAQGPSFPFGAPIWGLSVQFANDRFIAVSAWGGTVVSTNGTDWTLGSAPSLGGGNSLYLTGATYGGGRYVAVGYGEFGPTTSNIITSTDGVSWSYRRADLNEIHSLMDVAYGAGLCVVIGNNDGFTSTSSNFGIWIKRPILGGNAISFFNGIFIVPYGPGTNLISANGMNWATSNTGISNKLGKVAFANGLFIARAGNYLATSTDGTNWVQYPQPLPGMAGLPGWPAIATDGTRLVTIGKVGVLPTFYYDSFVYRSDPLVGIRMTNTAPPKVVLSGLVGRSYRIEATDDLLADTNAWQTLTTLQLPNTPYLFTDTTATNSTRFYRGVLLP